MTRQTTSDTPVGMPSAEALSAPPGFNVDFSLAFETDLPRRLLAFWRGKQTDGALPRRSEFDVVDLRDHLGWLCIAEVEAGADDLRYRLIGSKIASMVGRDMSGRLVSETLPAPALNIFRHLIAQPRPARTHGLLAWRDKEFMRHETLLLPLAEDGARVDHFLIEMVFPDRLN